MKKSPSLSSFARFALVLVCPACVTSNQTGPSTAPATIACAPNDPSWGCQNRPANAPNPPVATAAPAPATAVPTATATAPAATVAVPAATAAAPTPQPPVATIPVQVPLNLTDPQVMRNQASSMITELVAALDPQLRPRVASIPLVFDSSRTEVNAYATCSRSGKAAIAITDGMLILNGNLAELKAVDELYATRYLTEYAGYVAKNQKSGEAIVPPPSNWLKAEQRIHPQKVARQHHLFDEMLAFVFAHELAHHYLNHLPCTSILPLNAAELGLLLTDSVPAFNQPNETASDVAGIRNVLMAGKKRNASPLTETGGLAQLEFFGGLDKARPIDVFSFERTHPPPSLRVPVVQSAAQAYRISGGVVWPFGT